MEKAYVPQKYEKKIYRLWEKSGFFNPDHAKRGQRNAKRPDHLPQKNSKFEIRNSKFCIIMPPPNAYDRLHMGHAYEVALQDALIRTARMLGKKALWVPGYDHASIATEIKYQKILARKKQTKWDLGREKFIRRIWDFAKENIETVKNQLKALGASCDWSREKFTLDPKISREVQQTFVELYKKKLVYQSKRLAHWDVASQTVLSDLEITYQERQGKLYFLNYGSLTIATTRPETIFADSAVAVHPQDKRYQQLIGKKAVIPLINKKIPIIADSAVDPKFGTGALKITPAHDTLDWEIGQRHNLPALEIIDHYGRLKSVPKDFEGLKTAQARTKAEQALKKAGKLKKQEDYIHPVAVSERTGAVIEPILQDQWYLKMKPLASIALKAFKKGRPEILPERFKKIYANWLENIKDWPVSRQLWWGQRIPVWYCGTQNIGALQKTIHKIPDVPGCGQIIAAIDPPQKCPQCNNQKLIQDPDIFDTWFSSGQWPFNVLGFHWNRKPEPDFQAFFPTQVMAPGYEILFFWVARMVMLSLFATHKIPFKRVFIHGLVRDQKGRKMSRSLGNIIDPLKEAQNFGSDALRFALLYGASLGADQAWTPAHLIGGRNFANKLWNLGRFILLETRKQKTENRKSGNLILEPQAISLKTLKEFKLDKEDKRFFKVLQNDLHSATECMEKFDLSQALQILHNTIWHKFADQYVETWKAKQQRTNDQQQKRSNLKILQIFYFTLLKALHPFLPFVTESLWQELLKPKTKKEMLMIQKYPAL
jgi:valyl-tRNA synthetase